MRESTRSPHPAILTTLALLIAAITLTARPIRAGLDIPGPPTPTPHPLADFRIAALAERTYGEGDILVREAVGHDLPFYRYVIEYPSDGLTVTGLLEVPFGEGPYPVIVVLHGYIPVADYHRGDDALVIADYFARRGYAAIVPDYRGYMGTAGGPNPLRIPYAVDALHLIESLDTLDVLDADRVGVIGHSMGGGVATYVMVLSERVDATVLYAAMSADQAANWEHIHRTWSPFWMDRTAREYGSPASDPALYAAISPVNVLDRVRAPVQIHHGTADTEVPPDWSRDLHARLRAAGASSTLYLYPGAGHTFYGPSRDRFLERAFAFFETNVRGE